MLKKILMIGAIGVGVALMRGDVVKAHLAGTVYSPTYRHIASYDCTGTFGQVPNLEQHPALFECAAVVHAFEVVCQNPKGKIVTPGIPSGPRTVTQLGQTLLTDEDQSLEDKEKGRVSKTLKLPDSVLEVGNAICAARNRNWTAADELVQVADVWLRTYECPDPALDPTCAARVQASESYLRCTVPPQYSLPDNPPPGTPLDPIPTAYDCTLLAESHCDKGEPCPIAPVAFP